MIQASANSTHSPLVGEALALQFVAKVACRLQLHKPQYVIPHKQPFFGKDGGFQEYYG